MITKLDRIVQECYQRTDIMEKTIERQKVLIEEQKKTEAEMKTNMQLNSDGRTQLE